MENGSDVSKKLALVLILLTVFISAASTWLLVTSSVNPDVGESFNSAIIHLNIFRNRVNEPAQTDSNAGNARLFIAKGG